eukprot:1002047-Prymnesium_polylepis.1
MWQGFEKVRRPPDTRSHEPRKHHRPLITRIAPATKHVFRTGLSTGWRISPARGMPGHAHQAGDVQPALRLVA